MWWRACLTSAPGLAPQSGTHNLCTGSPAPSRACASASSWDSAICAFAPPVRRTWRKLEVFTALQDTQVLSTSNLSLKDVVCGGTCCHPAIWPTMPRVFQDAIVLSRTIQEQNWPQALRCSCGFVEYVNLCYIKSINAAQTSSFGYLAQRMEWADLQH